MKDVRNQAFNSRVYLRVPRDGRVARSGFIEIGAAADVDIFHRRTRIRCQRDAAQPGEDVPDAVGLVVIHGLLDVDRDLRRRHRVDRDEQVDRSMRIVQPAGDQNHVVGTIGKPDQDQR